MIANVCIKCLRLGSLLLASGIGAAASGQALQQPAPRVVVPTSASQQVRSPISGPNISYPWKKNITCTIFWIGELPTENNPTPNTKSSWDTNWVENFGGYDDPDPANRIASHASGEFRPKNFIPKLNPFYIALPYNDVVSHREHKLEAPRVIPWFARYRPEPGKTVCKGRWVQIFRGGKSCFAQWEDCGPWETEDWNYVFGNKPPRTNQNGGAGIDLSPAIRDYLGLKSGDKVHWRFVESGQVPYGPWKKYGMQNPSSTDPDIATQQRNLERLRKLRDEDFLKKPINEL
jgi:hypothetical protein